MASCPGPLVHGRATCPRLLVNGHSSKSWLLVQFVQVKATAQVMATGPSRGYLPNLSKSRILVQGKDACPRQGCLSKAWLLVQGMAACPRHGCLSKAWLLVGSRRISPTQ